MQTNEGTLTRSLYDEARREADRFKWLESERRRHDVGPAAHNEWARRYWATFLRHKRLEHLSGCCRYVEFEEDSFGCLGDEADDPALQFVINRFVEDRWENLHYFCSAIPTACSRERLLSWLEMFGINQLRQLTPPRWLLEAA